MAQSLSNLFMDETFGTWICHVFLDACLFMCYSIRAAFLFLSLKTYQHSFYCILAQTFSNQM